MNDLKYHTVSQGKKKERKKKPIGIKYSRDLGCLYLKCLVLGRLLKSFEKKPLKNNDLQMCNTVPCRLDRPVLNLK